MVHLSFVTGIQFCPRAGNIEVSALDKPIESAAYFNETSRMSLAFTGSFGKMLFSATSSCSKSYKNLLNTGTKIEV